MWGGSRGNRVGCEGGKSPFIGVSFEPKHERPWVVTRGKRASFTTGAEAAEHSDKAAAAAVVAKAKAGKKASAPRLNFQPRRNRSSDGNCCETSRCVLLVLYTRIQYLSIADSILYHNVSFTSGNDYFHWYQQDEVACNWQDMRCPDCCACTAVLRRCCPADDA